MSVSFFRVGLFSLALVATNAIVPWAALLPNASAQTPPTPSQQTVEVPLSQLNEIQQELRDLRERDAKRQVWEESVTKRLPQAEVDAANPPAVTPASGPQPSSGDANNSGD